MAVAEDSRRPGVPPGAAPVPRETPSLAVIPLAQALDPQRVGGKAAGLAQLLRAGLAVPPGFVVPAGAALDRDPPGALRRAVAAQLQAPADPAGEVAPQAVSPLDAAWAVRSSAVGEDGAHASFAGQLETFLDRRGVDAVVQAIGAVVESGRAGRVAAYAAGRPKPVEHEVVDPEAGTPAAPPGAAAPVPREVAAPPKPPEVAVVVQRQVDAAWAGVLFTADPVRGLRDRFVLSATPGLGEALVGGEVDGLDFAVHASGAVLHAPADEALARVAAQAGQDPGVLRRALPQLVADAWRAVERFGYPLDMEWAVARPAPAPPAHASARSGDPPEPPGPAGDGQVWWLQARPVTTLPAAHPNELDAPWPAPDALLTRGNVGEMMPGPVTPLTASVFVRAIDLGLEDFVRSVGAQGPPSAPSNTGAGRYIKLYYAHLFFDMEALYAIPRYVALNTEEDTDLSIVGRSLAGERPGDGPAGANNASRAERPPRAGRWRRATNFLRLLRYMRRAPRRADALAALASDLRWDPALADDLGATLGWLSHARDLLVTAYAHHYATSALSGSYHAAIMRVLAGGGRTRTPAHHAAAAVLLGDIEGVESAQVIRGVEALARALAAEPQAALRLPLAPADLWAWLRTEAPAALRTQLEDFLDTHGHRAVREAELRTQDWHDDPVALVALIQSQARAQAAATASTQAPTQVPAEESARFNLSSAIGALDPTLGVTRFGRLVLGHLVPRARAAVALRERTKSLAIRAQRQVKLGYRALGRRLVALGRLPDEDAVFFLTHDELVALAEDRAPSTLGDHAAARRALLPWLESLRFEGVAHGLPRPRETSAASPPRAPGALAGLPVSRGVATGRARVVRTLAAAARLEPGDILVAPMTDVGWTPYFGLAAGLVTEVGSPLSHGAVVAREYGLPAVVSVKGACDALAHEPVITVDGGAGTVRVVG